MINLVRRVRINDRIPAMWYNDKLIRTAYRKETLIVGEYEYDPNPSPYATKYFCIESLENGNTITFAKYDNNAPSNTYYTSTDLITWTEYYGTQNWTLNTGQKLYFKAVVNTWANNNSYWNFQSTKTCDITGNIMSLIYGDDFAGQTTLKSDWQFYNLFRGDNQNNYFKVVHADKLVLPATTLAEYCYRGMFNRCKSLTTAPTLPATTLAPYCYYYMFYNCTSLVNAPALPATTLATHCYGSMFNGCSALKPAPALPATTLAMSCYDTMFANCTSLTTAPTLPATTLAHSCYLGMFARCTSLTTAPALPATTMAYRCYMEMFKYCSALTTAPALPATTLYTGCYYEMFADCTSLTTAPELLATELYATCYYSMFSGCTKLNYIKCIATNISESECTWHWVENVAASGTFVKAASMNSWPSGISGIPSGWTVQDAA